MRGFVVLAIFAISASGSSLPDYQRNTDCPTCAQISALLERHSQEQRPSRKADLAMQIAEVIAKSPLRGKQALQQKREIFFAINATTEVIEDDFESETIVSLLKQRAQSPKLFDDVLWRFPLFQQKKIITRMHDLEKNGTVPNAKIPEPKQVEDH